MLRGRCKILDLFELISCTSNLGLSDPGLCQSASQFLATTFYDFYRLKFVLMMQTRMVLLLVEYIFFQRQVSREAKGG